MKCKDKRNKLTTFVIENHIVVNFKNLDMTKADIVAEIAEEIGLEKNEVQKTVEAFMGSVKKSLTDGENVYLRGFGSFVVKERAEKTGRNISKNTIIIIPAHNIPSFKPAKTFVEDVKTNVKVK
jgi:DNA-binding protein HU-beta